MPKIILQFLEHNTIYQCNNGCQLCSDWSDSINPSLTKCAYVLCKLTYFHEKAILKNMNIYKLSFYVSAGKDVRAAVVTYNKKNRSYRNITLDFIRTFKIA